MKSFLKSSLYIIFESLLLVLILEGILILLDETADYLYSFNLAVPVVLAYFFVACFFIAYGIIACFIGLLYAYFYNEVLSRKTRMLAVFMVVVFIYTMPHGFYMLKFFLPSLRFDWNSVAFLFINLIVTPISYFCLWFGGWSYLKLRGLKR